MTGPFAIGLIGGATSALLYVAALTGSPLAVFLFYLAPLPILLAGLGWGWLSAAVSAVAGGLVAAFIGEARLALFFLASAGAPSVVLSYLALLARAGTGIVPHDGSDTDDAATSPPGSGQTSTEWYPIGHLLIWAAGLSVGLALLALWILGPGDEAFRQNAAAVFNAILDANPDVSARLGDDASRDALIASLTAMLLPMTAASWTIAILFNLWLAGRLLKASDRLRRPWPELRSVATPKSVSIAFVAAIAVASLSAGLVSGLAAVAAGSLSIVFLIVGLAVVHSLVPNTPARPVILMGVYLVLIFIWFSGLLVILLGAMEPFINLRRRGSAGPPSPSNT